MSQIKGTSQFLDVQNLSTKEIVDLIKYNETYAACCKLIEEMDLNGQDILNLNEAQISTWKSPKWLAKNMLSLKTTLTNKPSSIFQSDDGDDDYDFPPPPPPLTANKTKNDSRKNIANTLECILKPNENKKGQFRANNHINQKTTNEYLVMKGRDKREPYNEDNYLNPNVFNNDSTRNRILSSSKPSAVKQGQPERTKTHIPHRAPTSAKTRLPLALPRSDSADENEYEPPPNPSGKIQANAAKVLPSVSDDSNVYEPPPRVAKTQRSFGSIKPSSVDDDSVYDNPDLNSAHSSRNTEIPEKKMKNTSKFYAHSSVGQYENFAIMNKSALTGDKYDSFNSNNKTSTQTNTGAQHGRLISSGKTPKSLVNRPLPPLPTPNKTTSKFGKPEVDLENKAGETEKQDPRIRNYKSDSEEIDPEYINTEVVAPRSFKSNTLASAKHKVSPTFAQSQLAQLVPEISEVKLKPKKHQSTLETPPIVADDLRNKLSKRREKEKASEDQHGKRIVKLQFEKTLPLPPPIKIFRESHSTNQNGQAGGSENEDEEMIVEYGNLELQPNVKSIGQPQASTSLLANILKTNVKRPNNLNTRKESILNDNDAEDLRQELLKRSLAKQTMNDGKLEMTLPLPPPSILIDFPDIDPDVKENTDSDEFSTDNDTDEEYDYLSNLNNVEFYRNTDRKGARALLSDLEDGAFVLRPSKEYFLSLTIKKNNLYYNLGIMKSENQRIYCGEGAMQTEHFKSMKSFLQYYEENPLIVQAKNGLQEVYLKKVLPRNRF